MAIMNRVGVALYNAGLVLALIVVFLCLKNYNFDSPVDTPDYSKSILGFIYIAVGAFLILGVFTFIITAASKARKKGALFWTLSFVLALTGLGVVVFTFGNPIFSDPLDSTAVVYVTVPVLTLISFATIVALLLVQLPGSMEKEKLVKAIKAELKKEVEETLPFCPECKNRVKPEWKCCPMCSAKFSD